MKHRLAGLLPCLLCLAGIIACTWVSFRIGLSLGTVGFLYLIFVVLAAFYGGFRWATLVSLVAVGCLDYFFDPPVFSFSVARLSNWVELGAFEFTALVISQLSNRAQLRAMEADMERRDTDRLYQAARSMLPSRRLGREVGVATWWRPLIRGQHSISPPPPPPPPPPPRCCFVRRPHGRLLSERPRD